MSDSRPNIASPVWTGPERRAMPERPPTGRSPSTEQPTPSLQEPEPERRKRHHLRPVWILLMFLVPCLALTFYYGQVVVPGSDDPDSFFPSTSYALVLLLINLDLIGFVVLLLLLSRNLIKAYFERRHRLIGSGFRTKLVAAFIGFSLIPTVLLALVASGLVNKAVDVWFSDQIDRVMRDSYEVAKMQHAGHITLAVNSARAISHEIFREDMLLPEQRDLLVAAMARKRVEFGGEGGQGPRPGGRPVASPHGARVRGRAADRRGPDERADRCRAPRVAQDGERARGAHPGQARRRPANRGGGLGGEHSLGRTQAGGHDGRVGLSPLGIATESPGPPMLCHG